MKKLLFLIPTLGGGGAERVLVDLINNLNPEKYEITLRVINGGGVNEKSLNKNIIYKPLFSFKRKFFIKLLFYMVTSILPTKVLSRMLINKKYDMEIAYLQGNATKIVAASSNKNSVKVAFVHSDFSSCDISHVYQQYLKSFKAFNKVFFVSKRSYNGFKKVFGYVPDGGILYNVLDEQKVISLSNEPISEKRSDRFLFVSIGRLCHPKGYDRLIEAVAKLKNTFDFEVWIIGEGNDRQQLEELIKKHGITNIKLMGYKENPFPYVKLADMFLCTSRHEGYSTVISEAIILGKAILTTDCSGMDEMLDDGKYGIIVENSIEGIQLGIKQVLENPQIQKEYSTLAQERSSFFSLEKNIKKYEQTIDNLLEG